jgi:hypothetical protein
MLEMRVGRKFKANQWLVLVPCGTFERDLLTNSFLPEQFDLHLNFLGKFVNQSSKSAVLLAGFIRNGATSEFREWLAENSINDIDVVRIPIDTSLRFCAMNALPTDPSVE